MMAFDLYDIPVIVVFVLLAIYFGNHKWIAWFFWYAAIIVFCALVYEYVFRTKKIKAIRSKHVVVSIV